MINSSILKDRGFLKIAYSEYQKLTANEEIAKYRGG